MALTDEERTKVRYHLGWHVTSENVINASGLPVSVPAELLLEKNIAVLTPQGETRVRECLCQLDKLEGIQKGAVEDMLVTKAGAVEIRKDYMELVESQYQAWQRKLADALGGGIHVFSAGNERTGAVSGFAERWSNVRA